MRLPLVILGVVILSRGTEAQDNLVSSKSLITGIQARGYSIDNGPKTNQFAVPLAAVVPVNDRFSFDVGTYYASTSSEPTGGSKTTVSGLTDTQIRASYVFGRDALVATLMLNLPTGKSQTIAQSGVTGAAAANFLAFPVNVYSAGTSMTGGVAFATELGSWNAGLAGSVRYSGEYEPFSDDTATYTPGAEARVKLGLERLMGASRLSLGFTVSTFGTDEFRNLGGGSGEYKPGSRFIGEVGVTFLAGQGTITGYLWDYYRRSAGNSGAANKENILSLGANGSWPLGTDLRLEPMVELRLWSPTSGSGKMFGAGAALQIPVGAKLSLSPGARFDLGSLEFTDGSNHGLTGWGFSVLVRYDI